MRLLYHYKHHSDDSDKANELYYRRENDTYFYNLIIHRI